MSKKCSTPWVIQDCSTFFSPSSLTIALLGLQIHWSVAFLLHGPFTINFKTGHWPVISCHSSLTKREQNLAAKRHISKINSWQGAKIITKKITISKSSRFLTHLLCTVMLSLIREHSDGASIFMKMWQLKTRSES